jgi:hypothetical protein
MFGSLLLLAAISVGAPQVQMNALDGSVTTGELQQLADGRIWLKNDKGLVDLPIEKVLNVIQKSPPAVPTDKPTAWIELIDGSKLTATGFEVEGNTATLNFGAERVTQIPIASIFKVRFSSPDDSSAPVWPQDAGAGASSDLLVVRKKDQVDLMEGSVGKVDENHVIFKADGENYPVSRAKVDGFIYYHKVADKLPEPLCTVETSAGWRLKLKDLQIATGPAYPEGRVEATSLSGDKISFLYMEQITKIDFSSGKITYLSDLEPASTQWTPYLDFGNTAPSLSEYYAPRHDEGREHQPLRLGGKTYNKGLALYSRTDVEYRVPLGMKQFKATVGIDDSVREAGNVRLQISVDGKQQFDQVLTGKDAPIDVSLDVRGAKRLSILVDYGDRFDAGDFLDLADARMLK